jgi:myosin heavy subunit
MVNLECLNDAELLINLQKRFEKRMIFTYVGPTLLIVNPYQLFPEHFNSEALSKYQKLVYNPQIQLKENPPHVWALSADAYRLIFECEKNQALVISGESGAGKTENTKYAMKFLTGLGKIEKRKSMIRKSLVEDPQEQSIEDKVKNLID